MECLRLALAFRFKAFGFAHIAVYGFGFTVGKPYQMTCFDELLPRFDGAVSGFRKQALRGFF